MGRSEGFRRAPTRIVKWAKRAMVPVVWVLVIGVPLGFGVRDAMVQDGEIVLATPWAALVGLGALLFFITESWLDWRRSGRLAHSHGALLSTLRPGMWVRLRHLPTALRTLSIVLLALALARPQDRTRREDTNVEGIDIVIVLDMSRSMAAEDMGGPRIEAAKQTILDFIRRRTTDRVGIVVFGREAYTLCPLTLDYNVLQSMVSHLQLGQVDGAGTAIGNAIGTAINRLRHSTARSKVIILVTDGDSNSGNVSPDQAARFAETLGIRVYPILIGTSDEASVSIGRDLFGLPIPGPTNRYPINPELLQRIASRTGGEYARATSRLELMRQVERIDRLERSRLRDRTVRYAERFEVPLLLGLLLLGLDVVLRTTRLRRFP